MTANTIRFSKMHGLGNDFMIIETLTQIYEPQSHQIKAWSDRHLGVGFDQLLMITPAISPEFDFGYRIFNADGTEVQQCGNGVRCIAKYVKDRGYTNKTQIQVATNNSHMQLTYQADGQIKVAMGVPNFEPAALPFRYPAKQAGYELQIAGEAVYFGAVSMGNPHIVIPVKDITAAAVASLGKALSEHPAFPEQVNVGFMEIVSPTQLKLRVYERGAAETLACGSGACAAMVIGRSWGLLDSEVTVMLPGGNLILNWDDAATPIYMTGPAEFVFDGEIQ